MELYEVITKLDCLEIDYLTKREKCIADFAKATKQHNEGILNCANQFPAFVKLTEEFASYEISYKEQTKSLDKKSEQYESLTKDYKDRKKEVSTQASKFAKQSRDYPAIESSFETETARYNETMDTYEKYLKEIEVIFIKIHRMEDINRLKSPGLNLKLNYLYNDDYVKKLEGKPIVDLLIDYLKNRTDSWGLNIHKNILSFIQEN